MTDQAKAAANRAEPPLETELASFLRGLFPPSPALRERVGVRVRPQRGAGRPAPRCPLALTLPAARVPSLSRRRGRGPSAAAPPRAQPGRLTRLFGIEATALISIRYSGFTRPLTWTSVLAG
jgi:hypothetical protein